ncbi:hypothetical protein BH10CYA1_BH10CYA1_64930 [soil metagenome]
MSNKGLLECEVSDGLFPEERAISFQNAQAEHVELFAPLRLVNDGRLEVSIVENDVSKGLMLIRLPSSPVNSSSIVLVAGNQVKLLVSA